MVFFFGQEFQTGKVYTTELASSETGVMPGPLAMQQINRLLQNVHNTESISPRWGYANRDFFPEGWDWAILPKGKVVIRDDKLDSVVTLQGTLTKRIQSFYWSVYRKKIPAHIVTQIGNAVGLDDVKTRTIYWDLTNSFAWGNGDYGDSGSCFWTTTDRGNARSYIRNNGGYAIRFYSNGDETNPENYANGIARAFLIPFIDEDGVESWVVTNGYGMTTQAIARIFAQMVGQSYRIIQLSVDGSWDGPVYINAQGKGYLIGDPEVLQKHPYVDFEWNTTWGRSSSYSENESSEDYTYCNRCNNRVDDEEVHHAGGHAYCNECYHILYNICAHCNNDVLDNDMVYIEGIDMYVCPSCRSHHYSRSNFDGEFYANSELQRYNIVNSNGVENTLMMTDSQLTDNYIQLDWPVYRTSHYARRVDVTQHTIAGVTTTMLATSEPLSNEPHDLTVLDEDVTTLGDFGGMYAVIHDPNEAAPTRRQSYVEYLAGLRNEPRFYIGDNTPAHRDPTTHDIIIDRNNQAPLTHWFVDTTIDPISYIIGTPRGIINDDFPIAFGPDGITDNDLQGIQDENINNDEDESEG